MRNVLNTTHEILGTAQSNFLPILTRFLLETSDLDTVDSVLTGVREKLEEFLKSYQGGSEVVILWLFLKTIDSLFLSCFVCISKLKMFFKIAVILLKLT